MSDAHCSDPRRNMRFVCMSTVSMLAHCTSMLLPGHILVSDECPGTYHVISGCVRRAFLCGDRTEHRRAWVRNLIRQAAGAFAVDVLSYAVMSNQRRRPRRNPACG
jgi:hypothetical protein